MLGKINGDALVGVALLMIGAIGVWATFQISANVDGGSTARLFPFAGSLALLGFGLIELAKARPLFKDTRLGLGKDVFQVLLMVVLSLLYVWMIARFGYLLSTSAAAVAALMVFGIRKPLGLVVAAILCPIVYHVIFFELLGVFPPFGLWFDLLDWLPGA